MTPAEAVPDGQGLASGDSARDADPAAERPGQALVADRLVADVVVVAAGASRRMGSVDKLALEIGGRPILAWTLAALAAAPVVRRIVVVTASERVAGVAAAPWLPAAVTAVVAGGARRQDSVAAGVAALDGGAPGDVVLVHDGARPLVSVALVERVAAAAARHGAAIPAVPVAETLKRLDGAWVAGTEDRTALASAQTPQGVRRDVLKLAWARVAPESAETWTDEAALLEACRIAVHAVPGETTNLKVTTPDDLLRVEAALVARGDLAAPGVRVGQATEGVRSRVPARPSPGTRVGFGEDGHPFGGGGPLALGGTIIEGAPRLHGHSDGDVVLHAVCDALLGAAGLGDLGRLFPAGPLTPAGIASRELLGSCLARVRAAGFAPLGLDVTVIGARPRLGGRLEAMAAAIADLAGLSAGSVNVKASSGNLLGPEGAGRAISARAVAVLGPAASGARE